MRRSILVLSALVFLLAACGRGSPPGSAFHRANLAEGESAALATDLVKVPGYFYEDVSEEELRLALASVPDDVAVAESFHEVRLVSSDDEIAFLQLFTVGDRMASLMIGPDAPTESFSGQTVYHAEDPSHPASRYVYAWDRHGTMGWADGPDRAAVERWLTDYFASLFAQGL